MEAKKLYWSGWAREMAAPASLMERAREAARVESDSMSGPGAVADRMVWEMLREAQRFWSAVRVQGGTVQPEGSPWARSRAVGGGC
jgi:hypothetical protein